MPSVVLFARLVDGVLELRTVEDNNDDIKTDAGWILIAREEGDWRGACKRINAHIMALPETMGFKRNEETENNSCSLREHEYDYHALHDNLRKVCYGQ